MSSFIEKIKERAKQDKKTIVLPESMDRRTFEAAAQVLKEDIANLIIIGTEEEIAKNSEGLDISKAKIINPFTYEKTEDYLNLFVELRKNKGLTYEDAKKTALGDYMYYACLMVKAGDADGVVSGACHSTANTLRPSLQIIKTKPGVKLVSSFFVMVVPNCEYGENGVFVFADCGLEQNPDSEKLAAIAQCAAESFELLVEKEPRVALLSHSSMGSAKHADVDKVVEAVRIAKENAPELKLDGELQLDAAISQFARCRKSERFGIPRPRRRKHRLQACSASCKSRSIRPGYTGYCNADKRFVARMQCGGYCRCCCNHLRSGTGEIIDFNIIKRNDFVENFGYKRRKFLA